MALSTLQKFILKSCLIAKSPRFHRRSLTAFYDKSSSVPAKNYQADIITNSLERLIDRGLLIGYGQRTAKKWFISEVALTASGRKTAKSLFGRQQKLKI